MTYLYETFKRRISKMCNRLEGKVAIITGAGRGLGKVLALRFSQEGATLLLPDISLERAEITAAEIRAAGGRAVAMETDISDENKTQQIAERAIEIYGRVDILLNNAALISGFLPRSWDQWTVEIWDRFFNINVRGTWLVCKAIAPLMVKQSKGKIINIVSDIPKLSQSAIFLPYACSKGALYTLTHSLARALGPSNINVNAIAPGRTATDTSLTGNPDIDRRSFEDTIAIQCLKRREEPEDLSGAAVFLASSDSDFVTGHCLFVDGGAFLL
jgi:NAD(P)-dependent dehydrogenase (short-subunit alcohol dehydrogenase family)